MVSPTQHFVNLGAPLRNSRWSWGAQRDDGTTFFRAWEDEIEFIDGKRHIRLTNNAVYSNGIHTGFRERLRHISEVRQGAQGYVIICRAEVPKASNRRLKGFDEETLTKIVRIKDHLGDQWAELGEIVIKDDVAA